MNHRKSMRIFWLSLCLLLVSGAIIIAAARARFHKKASISQEQQDIAQSKQDTKVSDEGMPGTDTVQPDQRPDDARTAAGVDAADDQILQPASGQTSEYVYELRIQNGCLDVYYYHTEQLFFHTGIPSYMLTEQQMLELEEGKYFKNEQELYGYLESCTS